MVKEVTSDVVRPQKKATPRTQEKITIPEDDQSDLVWWFGIGQTVFERSTCGAMLDALYRDSCVSVRCKRCKGAGIIGADDWSDPENGQWCDKCKGTGTLPIASKKSKHALTAKPKKVTNYSNGKTPNDRSLTRYASVSRRINLMQETDPESVQVIAAYFGNAGTRWAQTEGYSRLFPVLTLTKPGQNLIKRSQGRTILQDQESDVPRDAHEQLGQIHLINKVQPEPNRIKLFGEAYEQAEKKLERAALAWLATEGNR